MKISRDKLEHFMVGAGVSYIIGGLVNPMVGLFTAIGIGFAKELIWDKVLNRSTPEFMDAVATFAGAVLGYLLHCYLF